MHTSRLRTSTVCCTWVVHGFDIGFNGTTHTTKPKNLKSAGSNESSVDAAIDKELARGHTCGPFRHPPMVDLHCSPIGGIIKKDGSCRLIMDLSQPKGLAINECIKKRRFRSPILTLCRGYRIGPQSR